MRFRSTRRRSPELGFSDALATSLAPDGGLYVPVEFPAFASKAFDGPLTAPAVGARLLAPFLDGDALAPALPAICEAAFDFPVPLVGLDGGMPVLELFHGPTAAFKDFAARFLAECVARLPSDGPRTVLVATSGDTGGAVAAAFHGRPGIEVRVLYPKGLVSARQEKQLTTWGGNVHAYAVRGTFDDCQRIVKQAFSSTAWASRRLLSANSISIGRLLPQAVYYALASLHCARAQKSPASFVVPSGNLGNATAALWAKRLGLPIGRVVLAHNANRAVPAYLESGTYAPLPTVATLANAMDVGAPSNMERVLDLYPTVEALRRDVVAYSVDDDAIGAAIVECASAVGGRVLDPHTATAWVAARALRDRFPDEAAPILVATAHPAKFESIVEPLVGHAVEPPPALAAILHREGHAVEIDATLAALEHAVGV